MVIEELAEWLLSHANDELVAAADAWVDRAYVLLGDAVAAGLPAGELFTAVHQRNMTKEMVADGTGKARKEAAYRPPSLAAILKSAGADR
jgi:predicted HAD superfamily Cof-like phosphohydrolase